MVETPPTEDDRQRPARWGLPVPPGLKHGQRTKAKAAYGCDCSLCLPSGRRNRPPGQRKPQGERNRALRAAKKGKPVPEGTKHGLYAYRTYACRCRVCVVANNENRPKSNWRDKAHGRWSTALRNGEEYDILCWPPRTAGPAWTCPEEAA